MLVIFHAVILAACSGMESGDRSKKSNRSTGQGSGENPDGDPAENAGTGSSAGDPNGSGSGSGEVPGEGDQPGDGQGQGSGSGSSGNVVAIDRDSVPATEFISIPQNMAGFSGFPDAVTRYVSAANGRLAAATRRGLALSDDGGKTFVTKTTAHGLPANHIDKAWITRTTVIAVSVEHGVYISQDGGATFAKTEIHPRFIDVDAKHGVVATIAASDDNKSVVLKVSRDGGLTFKV